jgi:hypothetical protein
MAPRLAFRKFVQGTAIAGGGVLAIISGVGAAGLVGQAHADDPPCVAGAADPCLVDAPRPAPPPRRAPQMFCQPAGMAGQHCFQRSAP